MKKLLFLLLMSLFFVNAHAENTKKGYHGFLDVGYCYYVGGTLDPSTIEITTSHGYQFNPYLFLGAGVGIDITGKAEWGDIGGMPYSKRDSKIDIPVFLNLRTNFTKTRFIPFFDAKAGVYVTNGTQIYANGALGCRYSFGNNLGLSLAVGYEYRKVTVNQLYISKYGYNVVPYYINNDEPLGGPVFKLGFDF